MTDWIRRKLMKTPNEQNSFTSYLEEEVGGFIVIPHAAVGAPEVNSIKDIKEITRVDCDYESLYSFLNLRNGQIASQNSTPYPMGCSPSTTVASSSSEMATNSESRRTSFINVAPFPLVTTPPHNPEGSSSLPDLFGAQYFLHGVPFKLSKEFNQLEEVNRLEKESSDFLKKKVGMLERLDYNFQVENEVLKESTSET